MMGVYCLAGCLAPRSSCTGAVVVGITMVPAVKAYEQEVRCPWVGVWTARMTMPGRALEPWEEPQVSLGLGIVLNVFRPLEYMGEWGQLGGPGRFLGMRGVGGEKAVEEDVVSDPKACSCTCHILHTALDLLEGAAPHTSASLCPRRDEWGLDPASWAGGHSAGPAQALWWMLDSTGQLACDLG